MQLLHVGCTAIYIAELGPRLHENFDYNVGGLLTCVSATNTESVPCVGGGLVTQRIGPIQIIIWDPHRPTPSLLAYSLEDDSRLCQCNG